MRRALFLMPVAALVALAGTAGASTSAGPSAVSAAPPAGKIKHVIVIYQENHSFDETLGAFCIQHHRCNGSIGPVRLKDGTVVPLTVSPDIVNPDPPHETVAQAAAIDGGKMDGWANMGSPCQSATQNVCLTYYKPSGIPSLAAFASKYVVSDRTFSMQDSPSWGGHVYAAAATQDGFSGDTPHNSNVIETGEWGCDSKVSVELWTSSSGTTTWQPACIPAPKGYLDPTKYPNGGAQGPTKVPNVPTIFDRLDAKHLAWKLYSTVTMWSICPEFAKCLYGPQHNNVVATTQILDDAKKGTLPAYSVVLPSGPGGILGGTGQHPPGSMMVGDDWIGQVVKAVQASKNWSSTAIFITYDDCGCFYDHVAPGKNPDGTGQGIRVPMVIVSPYAKLGATDSTPATFASILKFAEETFGLAALSKNDAHAYDYANSFNFSKPGTAPRTWPRAHPISDAEKRLLATLPPDDADPT